MILQHKHLFKKTDHVCSVYPVVNITQEAEGQISILQQLESRGIFLLDNHAFCALGARKGHKSKFVLLIPVKGGFGPGFVELHSVPKWFF